MSAESAPVVMQSGNVPDFNSDVQIDSASSDSVSDQGLPAVASGMNDASASFVEKIYYEISQLTKKPLLLRDIPPDAISFIPNPSREPAILRLFLNEYGEVDNVMIDSSLLSEGAQEMLVQAFLKVKFQPGEIDGTSVKSQIRIEVRIENTITEIS